MRVSLRACVFRVSVKYLSLRMHSKSLRMTKQLNPGFNRPPEVPVRRHFTLKLPSFSRRCTADKSRLALLKLNANSLYRLKVSVPRPPSLPPYPSFLPLLLLSRTAENNIYILYIY